MNLPITKNWHGSWGKRSYVANIVYFFSFSAKRSVLNLLFISLPLTKNCRSYLKNTYFSTSHRFLDIKIQKSINVYSRLTVTFIKKVGPFEKLTFFGFSQFEFFTPTHS